MMTQREKQLFIYIGALEQGDFDTVTRILEYTESDPELERMILDANEELINELPVLSAISKNNDQATEENNMNITLPIQHQDYRKTQTLPLTLLVATIVTVLFAAFIFFQDQNSRPTLSLGTTPEQSLQDESENVTTFEQYLSAWETYDASLLEGIVTDDYVLHLFPGGWNMDVVGMDEMAELLNEFENNFFFDGTETYTIESISENTVENQLWASVIITMDTLVLDTPTTAVTSSENDTFTLAIEYIVSLDNGQISEVWAFLDTIDLLAQAGILEDIAIHTREQHNLRTVETLIQEIWNDVNYANLDTYYAEGFTLISPLDGAVLEWTLADAEEAMVDLHYAFSELEMDIETISANGNTVTVEFTANAIHTGLVYIGDGRMNPTGEPISWTGIFVYEFDEDGLIIEERNYWTFNEYTRAFFGVED